MPDEATTNAPVKITVWQGPDGYCLERSDDPGVLYIYATHTPKLFLDKIRAILYGLEVDWKEDK